MKPLSFFSSALITIPFLLHAKAPKELLKEAQANAAQSKKDVFMIFSGSAWHPQSKSFEEKVLKTDPFKKAMGENFVQVLFDIPGHGTKLTNIFSNSSRIIISRRFHQ